MRVVDSSVWIELLSDQPIADRLEALVPTDRTCIVPTIVQLEVWKWAERSGAKQARNAFLAITAIQHIVPLSTEIAVRAARLSISHKLATADAVVYATAIELEADLLTCDKHFEGLVDVIYIPKV